MRVKIKNEYKKQREGVARQLRGDMVTPCDPGNPGSTEESAVCRL
jgi:hypothetical protein